VLRTSSVNNLRRVDVGPGFTVSPTVNGRTGPPTVIPVAENGRAGNDELGDGQLCLVQDRGGPVVLRITNWGRTTTSL
jgi:hypothetical protein